MSDELIKSLNRRIEELDKQKSDLDVALRIARKEKKEIKAQFDELSAKYETDTKGFDSEKTELAKKVEEYEAKFKAAPDEKDATIGELKAKLLERDHRDAWKDAIGSELHEKASVEKLWREIEYKPDGDPDPAKITEFVSKAKESAPYLFRPTDPAGQAGGAHQTSTSQAKPKAPLTVASGDGGRGARDTSSGTVRISRSEMQEPGWMSKDKAKAAAFKAGDYTLVDD